MSKLSSLETALNKFERAISVLEGAGARVRKQLSENAAVASEFHATREDRSRLADELDRAKAKLSDLDQINSKAVRQLNAAMAVVSRIVNQEEGGR